MEYKPKLINKKWYIMCRHTNTSKNKTTWELYKNTNGDYLYFLKESLVNDWCNFYNNPL